MSKPGLGKGLGELMNGDQVAGQKPGVRPSAPSEEVSDTGFGRGLNTLVSAKADSDSAGKVKIKHLLPAWFFFSADLLLLSYTIAITLDATRPFHFGTICFCAASVGLGCALGIAGVLRASAPS